MGKIDTSEAVALSGADDEKSGSLLLGMAFLVVALPFWAVRLLGHALYRDVKAGGRFVRLCGSTYAETMRRS